MFLSSKILVSVSLVAVLAAGTTAHAASTNPWALHQQQGQTQGQIQGNFNMGGGFTLGGSSGGNVVNNGQPQSNYVFPQFVAPQPVMPAQPPAQPPVQQMVPQPAQQNKAPVPTQQQFGIYPPLSQGNTQTIMTAPRPQAAPIAPQVQPYGYAPRPYGYGQTPYGFNPGYGGFGFPGFGGFPGFNGFNNFGFGFGFGGGLVAPGPAYSGYGVPGFQRFQQPSYRVQPGRQTR